MEKGSFLDDENQMVVDAICYEIGMELFEDWNNSNLDEGTFWADYQIALRCDSNYLKGRFNQFYDLNYQIALRCDSNYLKGRFNQFYDLKPGDDEYITWDEEA